MKSVFAKGHPGQRAFSLPKSEKEFASFQPDEELQRKSSLPLPEISEMDLTRHFAFLSRRNVGIDNIPYPLGSCTMKLNPRINEVAAKLKDFALAHPLLPETLIQGSLELLFSLAEELARLTGMKGGTLAPCAGAHGEFVGIQMIKAYHRARGDHLRTEIIVPDSAHGTNPATARMAGFSTITIPADAEGDIDLEALKKAVSPKTAGLMMTNPSTLGLFSKKIKEIAKIIHDAGGLLYYDGANLNAILEVAYPGEMGFDVMHLNLHKTFSTPHGGGGPGAGPVLVAERLIPFLPLPRIIKTEEGFKIEEKGELSIGRITSFFGNFSVCLRAYLYILLHGRSGLRRIAESATLHANYLKKRLANTLIDPFPHTPCMHECVFQAKEPLKAIDIAKRLLDFGIHAPTVYFPTTVRESLLIEPTESESLVTLDTLVNAIEAIYQEDQTLVKSAPHTLPVTRLDEVKAAKELKLTFFDQ